MIFLLALGRLYGNRFVAELKICNGSLRLPHQCSYPAQEAQGPPLRSSSRCWF